jgi:hypothetical protein
VPKLTHTERERADAAMMVLDAAEPRIRKLAAEVDLLRLRREIHNCHTCQRHKELEAEVARLRKALEWYANPNTWAQWNHADAGDRARMALEGRDV